uniref:Fermentation-respiration switch protein n=1 Tax=Pithovirus LCPAC406 TaxID=2506599 RepID=A0A481ZI08_9VIRU|nr:MAG: fermentation-respiration switch protein [Pithovirus LCPAC406]
MIIFILLTIFLLTFIIVHTTLDLVVFRQSSVIFEIEFPSEELFITDEGISTGEDINAIDFLKSKEGIHIMRYHINNDSPVILHCHGNNANLSARQYMVSLSKVFNLNLIIFDYHGFGLSSDSVSVKHLRRDTLAAYRYTISYYHPSDIIIWGESLGGTVASWLASEYECSRLILVSAFSSLDDMMLTSELSYFVTMPFAVIVRLTSDPLSTKRYLKNVTVPTLIIHSSEDQIISPKSAMINFKSLRCKKKMIKIKGDHQTPRFSYANVETLLRFISIDHDLITPERIRMSISILNSIDMSEF